MKALFRVSVVLFVVCAMCVPFLTSAGTSAQGDDDEKMSANPVVQRIYTAFNEQDFENLDEFVSPDFVLHQNSETNPFGPGIQGFATWITVLTTFVPDWHLTIEAEVEQDGLNATLWSMEGSHTGEFTFPSGTVVPPTGNTIELDGILMARIVDDKVEEIWIYFDLLAWEILTGQIEAPPAE